MQSEQGGVPTWEDEDEAGCQPPDEGDDTPDVRDEQRQ